MNSPTREKLYSLLPAIYRRRDREQGETLRALLAVLESQLERIERDIDTQYDNWFIETCRPWVIPYLGRLLGDPHAEQDYRDFAHPRRWVGRLQELRRLHGAPVALETAIQAVTGWHAHVVEFQRQLGLAQSVDAPLPHRGRLADVRQSLAMRHLDGPLNEVSHLVDVRRVESGQGRYNLRNLGVFLWRIAVEPVLGVQPGWHGRAGCFTFDPLGVEAPLFYCQPPRPSGQRARTSADFPGPFDRDTRSEDLAAVYGEQQSLAIHWRGQLVPSANLVARRLTGAAEDAWDRALPPPRAGSVKFDPRFPVFLVDPQRGRLAVAQIRDGTSEMEVVAEDLRVTFHRGLSGPLGGGYYERHTSLTHVETGTSPPATRAAIPSRELDTHLAKLSDELSSDPGREQRHLVRIFDNGTCQLEQVDISLPRVGWLAIEAEDGARPCLTAPGGPLRVLVSGGGRDAILILNGLFIRGTIVLLVREDGEPEPAGPLNIHIRHCTITGGIQVARPRIRRRSLALAQASAMPDDLPLGIHIEDSVVGPLRLPAAALALTVRRSIVDHRNLVPVDRDGREEELAIGGLAEQDYGPPLTIHCSTILGRIRVRHLVEATGVLGSRAAEAERLDVGQVGDAYFPAGNLAEFASAAASRPPAFHSQAYGNPRYAQLRPDNDAALLTGASDGSELGVHGPRRQHQRERKLREMLEEWVPVSLRAGLFFET